MKFCLFSFIYFTRAKKEKFVIETLTLLGLMFKVQFCLGYVTHLKYHTLETLGLHVFVFFLNILCKTFFTMVKPNSFYTNTCHKVARFLDIHNIA